MDGIIIGHSPTYNALLVYNPRNKQYYEPDSYRIDSYCLPGSVYRDLKYDGGLFCSLYRDDNPPIEELYPPGTRVERIDPTSNMLLAGTVMDIPLLDDSSTDDSSDSSLCTLYSLIMAPPPPSPFEIWRPSFLNLRLTLVPPILKTLFSLPSFG